MFKDDELHETRYCENCLELQQELQAKEQECEKLKEKQKELLHDCNSCKFHQYKQALDEIERFMIFEFSGQNEWVKNNVLNIIDKAKDNKE